jgi:hypothetical protein
MRYAFVLVMVTFCVTSCTSPRKEPPPTGVSQQFLPADPTTKPTWPRYPFWTGTYVSTSEISGYSGTVLALDADGSDQGRYRMRFYSDAHIANEIMQDEAWGSFLASGPHLYLPLAHGQMENGKPSLSASLERYTFAIINTHAVLLRDDALAAFRKDNKLYDYGILIRISDRSGMMEDLTHLNHPSIKQLYSDPGKPWNDPFVHGPNER